MSDGAPQARRSARSFALFNNRHMADIARHALELADAGDGLFTTRLVAASTGLADSVVRPVMLRLVDAEILTRLPRLSTGRSAQYFSVVDAEALALVASLPDRDPAAASVGPT
ncbi:MAG TPA: hypothetical protein P5544_15690 [Candidatus Nanopelagicales bacterium]|nr:hypothetical protein [Candidatus Nanopelagicales bacterium]